MFEQIQNIDWSILNWIHNTLGCGLMDKIMTVITYMGSKGAIWIVIALALIVTKKYRRHGVILLLGLLAGVIIGNLFIKNIVARPRPFALDETIKIIIGDVGGYSFPSGHTLSSAIAATILTMTRRKFAFFAIPLAALIAFSRLYLRVHFPSDVIGAAILGFALGAVVFTALIRLFKLLNKKYGHIKAVNFFLSEEF